MNIIELSNLLETLGYPVANGEFLEEQSFPYIIYNEVDVSTFSADNEPLLELLDVDIELYSDIRNYPVEDQLKKLLKDNKLNYTRFSTYIESEEMWQVVFSVRLLPKI